jgi:organic radical activating enzyme
MPPQPEICMKANELKVIVQDLSDFEWAEEYRRQVSKDCLLFLQPEWSSYNRIIDTIVDYIKKNSAWRISLQAHKFMHIP